MSETPQAPRGTFDVLPEQAALRHAVEQTTRRVLESAGYRRIETPVFEATELFRRTVGESTDIVQKEMYTFDDRNGVSITLRPEATAGIVRACMEHGLVRNQRQKFYTTGPMFRYEKPQKGRYRQFHQYGAEALGFAGPDVHAKRRGARGCDAAAGSPEFKARPAGANPRAE